MYSCSPRNFGLLRDHLFFFIPIVEQHSRKVGEVMHFEETREVGYTVDLIK